MEKDKFTALIPLRGGSKSIPDKNIKLFMGKPLCYWVLRAACSSSQIDSVWVSTDSQTIRETVRGFNLSINVLDRPLELASDTASTESVMLHFAKEIDITNLVTIQATSPLLSSDDLDTAIKDFMARGLDSLFSSVRSKRFFWNEESISPLNYDYLRRPRRQDFNGLLMENGSFYITRKNILLDTECRLGGKIGFYEMSEEHSLEIDEPMDWTILEAIAKNKNELTNGNNS